MSFVEKQGVTESTTLSNKVCEALRKDILMGVFKPGQKLLLNQLKERYQVGGSPIREALLVLAWHKYVVMEPQRGFWVAPTSLNELRDILNSRRILVESAIERSLADGDEKWELEVLAAFHRLNKIDLNDSETDYQEWADRHMDFHLAIIKGGRSEVMVDLMESIYNRLERYRHIWLDRKLPLDKRYSDNGEHRKIMEAVLARDLETTLHILDRHYSHIMQIAESLAKEKKNILEMA